MEIMSTKPPALTLNNGVEMPAIGLGTLDRKSPDLIPDAVATAIAKGYRLIDTAASYRTERQVGEGIARSGIKRAEMFITTKLWLTQYGYDSTLRAFDSSLRKLRLDYLDLYLLHWPVPSDFQATLESYRALKELLAEGRVRAIGVANFGAAHLKTLIAHSGVTPAVNQVELHPFFIQRELRHTNSRLGIVTQSWSPLGNSVRIFSEPGESRDPLSGSTLVDLARKHRKTPAQIALRWHTQHGLSTIPKSIHPERITENINIFGFTLTADEMAQIDAMDTGKRSGPDPEAVHARTFAFKLED
jgi:diketogulonate reductase-like aldo/keto reductase